MKSEKKEGKNFFQPSNIFKKKAPIPLPIPKEVEANVGIEEGIKKHSKVLKINL